MRCDFDGWADLERLEFLGAILDCRVSICVADLRLSLSLNRDRVSIVVLPLMTAHMGSTIVQTRFSTIFLLLLIIVSWHNRASWLPRMLGRLRVFGGLNTAWGSVLWLGPVCHILGRTIVCMACITPAIVAIWWSSNSLCFWKVTDLVHIVIALDLVIWISRDFLIHIWDFLSAIKDLFTHSTIGIRIDRDLELVTAHVAHGV